MTRLRARTGKWRPIACSLAVTTVVLVCAAPVRGQDCSWLLGVFQQGLTTAEIARETGMTGNQVETCRRQLRQPIFVGPAGVPPQGAVGPPPRNAAGPPPVGAAGPPPSGAAGPPPSGAARPPHVGHEVKRLP